MAKNWKPGDEAMYQGGQVKIVECGTAVATLEKADGRRIEGVFLEDLRPVGTSSRPIAGEGRGDESRGRPGRRLRA